MALPYDPVADDEQVAARDIQHQAARNNWAGLRCRTSRFFTTESHAQAFLASLDDGHAACLVPEPTLGGYRVAFWTARRMAHGALVLRADDRDR